MVAFDEAALTALLTEQRYEEVAPQLDEDELKSATQEVLSGDWPVVIHILAHLYNGRLTNARFLWKRIPEQRKSQDAELAAALQLLQMMWNRDYQGVWQALALPAWRPQSQPLMEALGNRIRSHNLKLLTRSYTSISVSKVAAMLGIPQAAVAEGDGCSAAVQREGWAMDPSSGLCQINQPEAPDIQQAEPEQLEELTQYLLHLESS